MFDTVLVADRGEIARRVVRTCQRLGIKAVTVHSEADAKALHVTESDESVLLGPAPPEQSYLDGLKVLEAARQTGAQALHPGYGFLAENAEFARAVVDAGLAWIGPPPEVIELLSDKVASRAAAAAAGLPVALGSGVLGDEVALIDAARSLGYPLIVKPVGGGGGIGMRVVTEETGLAPAFAVARGPVLAERYLPGGRHVEVQLLGLADGTVATLGDRECSVQRRHQKVVEEAPAPALDAAMRGRLIEAAQRVGEAVGYVGAGTVEFLVHGEEMVFLEMNPRLQVEHPVTEAVTGVDVVEQQLRVAAGEPPSYDVHVRPSGHALELRVYAEDPQRFLPGPGTISRWEEPVGEGIRVDAACRAGDEVTPYYDPLLAKLVVWAPTRPEALARAREAVASFVVAGPKVNLPFLAELLDLPEFVSGDYDTGIVGRMRGTT